MFKIAVVPSGELAKGQTYKLLLKSLYNTDRKKYNRLRMVEYRKIHKNTEEYKSKVSKWNKTYNENMPKEVKSRRNTTARRKFKNLPIKERQRLKEYLNEYRRNASPERKRYLADYSNKQYHNLTLEQQRNRRTKKRSKMTNKDIFKEKEYNKKYRIDNLKDIKIKNRIWRTNNKDKCRALARKNKFTRRTKEKLLTESFNNKEWTQKLMDTFGVCPKCDTYIGINKLTLDHIVPISKAPEGYVYTIDEVQPLCSSCNSSKGVKVE